MAASAKPATTNSCWNKTAGTPASGAINNWKPASMLSKPDETSAPRQTWQAAALLRRAAQPDLHHLYRAVLWLILAALLEVMGPIMGKALIDQHLLPRHLDWPRMAALLAGVLLTGWIASGLRYLQLVRLSGLAMRSVMRLREMVYTHVLLLPMAFL